MSLGFARRTGMMAVMCVVIGSLVLVGCGSSNSSGASPTATTGTTKTDNVYFILNWLPNVEFAGLWVAQQKGWFKQAHINMGFKGWAPGVAPETDVPARGGNTFGFQSGAAIAIAKSKGVPIRAIYSDTQKSVFGLTVLTKSGITKLSQLKGKRIGYQSHEFYVPSTMMSCIGVSDSEWKPVQVGFDPSQLTSGQVDAYLSFITNEPIALKLQGVATKTFPASDYCFHFYDDVLFTTTGLIKSNPDLVRRVTEVAAKGFQWAHTHPIQAAKLTVSNYFPASKAGSGVTAANNLKQQELELQTFSRFSADKNGNFTGLMNTSTWQDSINTLFKYNEIKTKPSATAIYTNQFNPYK